MLKVFNPQIEFLGFLTGVENFQHISKLGEIGTFTFSVPFTSEYKELCSLNNFIYLDEDVSGIILSRSLDVDSHTITVSGKTLEEILTWRPCLAGYFGNSNTVPGYDYLSIYQCGEHIYNRRWAIEGLVTLSYSGCDTEGIAFPQGPNWDITRCARDLVENCFGINNDRNVNIGTGTYANTNWPIENLEITYDSIGLRSDLGITTEKRVTVPIGSTCYDFLQAFVNAFQGIVKVTFKVDFTNKKINLHIGKFSNTNYTISSDTGLISNAVLTESSANTCNAVYLVNTAGDINDGASLYPTYYFPVLEKYKDTTKKGLDLRIKTATSSTSAKYTTTSSIPDYRALDYVKSMEGEENKYFKTEDFTYDCVIDTDRLDYNLRLGDTLHIIDKNLEVEADRVVTSIQTTLADDNTPIRVYSFQPITLVEE